MQNPLRSEAAAFRFLIGLLVYLALIVAAKALAGAAAALVVFVLLTAAAVVWAFRS